MSASTATAQADRYGFEGIEGHAGSHRDSKAARIQLDVLWRRLGGDVADLSRLEQSDPDAHHLLLRYVIDAPLNIEWYDNKRPRLMRRQRAYNVFIFGMAGLVFLLAFLMPFLPVFMKKLGVDTESVAQTGVVDAAALVGLLGTGAMVALRVSSHVVRYRQQAAVFHEASALLKEQLYTFEDAWRGKTLVVPSEDDSAAIRVEPEFGKALRKAVNGAQAIIADERDRYFGTLILDVQSLADATEGGAAKIGNQVVARSDRRHPEQQAKAALEAEIAAVELERDTAKAKAALLEKEMGSGDPNVAAEVRSLLRMERQAVEAANQRLLYLNAKR